MLQCVSSNTTRKPNGNEECYQVCGFSLPQAAHLSNQTINSGALFMHHRIQSIYPISLLKLVGLTAPLTFPMNRETQYSGPANIEHTLSYVIQTWKNAQVLDRMNVGPYNSLITNIFRIIWCFLDKRIDSDCLFWSIFNKIFMLAYNW